ncbi:MAG: heparinase II/III family protein [Deltaproteobacteria bacterium]|nr:heparinase II/III family protein [Deltaproteobacteria bacterium]
MRTEAIALALIGSLAIGCTTEAGEAGSDFSGQNNTDDGAGAGSDMQPDAGTPTTPTPEPETPTQPDPVTPEPTTPQPQPPTPTTPQPQPPTPTTPTTPTTPPAPTTPTTPTTPPAPTPSANPSYATQHPRIYMATNKSRLQARLAANGPAASRFKTLVDQWVGGANIWGFRAWNGALLGQLTNDPKYCAKSVAVVEAQVTTAEAAIAGGQRPVVASDSYLEIGDLIGDLALVYDWCNPSLTASQKTRWLAYANQAVWNVWNPTQAKWGNTTFAWSGWATNDPSNNYYYSFTRATMLLGLASHGESAQGAGWLTQFRDTKMLGQLVPTFTGDLQGGGSREGTGYGVAMRNLWKLYDLWYASTGEDLANKTGHTRASMLAFMHQVMPTGDKIAPTGDLSRDSTSAFFDYHRDYLQTLITMYSNDGLASRAKKMLESVSVTRMGSQFMAIDDFLYDSSAVASAPIDLNNTYHATGIGQLYARSSWSDPQATWVNMTAGPYTQSHAHQDQGSIMLYKGGWLGYDAVIHSKSGLPQQTTAHSLVRVNSNGAPVRQVANTISTMTGLKQTAQWTYAGADLKPAYNGNAAISMMQREMVFLPPNVVVVYDRVNTAAGTQQTWQFAMPVSPTISGNTATMSNGGHSLSIQRLAPSATTSVTSMTSVDADFTGGFRLDQTMAGGNHRYLHVMSIDGAATSVASANDSTVTLSVGGKTATIAFNRDAPGGTMTFDGTTTALSGVATLAP